MLGDRRRDGVIIDTLNQQTLQKQIREQRPHYANLWSALGERLRDGAIIDALDKTKKLAKCRHLRQGRTTLISGALSVRGCVTGPSSSTLPLAWLRSPADCTGARLLGLPAAKITGPPVAFRTGGSGIGTF